MKSYRILGPNDPALGALAHVLKAHPEWEMELVILPWVEYQAAMNAALEKEVSPYQAVCAPGHIWLPGLVAKGQLAAFEPLLEHVPGDAVSAFNAGDLLAGVTDETRIGGLTYLIPGIIGAAAGRGACPGLESPLQRDLPGLAALPLGSRRRYYRSRRPAGIRGGGRGTRPRILRLAPPILPGAGRDLWECGDRFRLTRGLGSDGSQLGRPGGRDISRSNEFGRSSLLASMECGLGVSIPANQPEAAQSAVSERLYRACGPVLDAQVTQIAGSPVRMSSYRTEEFERYPWLKAQFQMLGRARRLPADPRLAGFLGDLYNAVYRAFIGQMSAAQALQAAKETAERVLS